MASQRMHDLFETVYEIVARLLWHGLTLNKLSHKSTFHRRPHYPITGGRHRSGRFRHDHSARASAVDQSACQRQIPARPTGGHHGGIAAQHCRQGPETGNA